MQKLLLAPGDLQMMQMMVLVTVRRRQSCTYHRMITQEKEKVCHRLLP